MANIVSHLPKTDTIALIGPDGHELSYRELAVEVERVAGGLHRLGIREGDRIVLLIPMSIDLYVALLAIFYLGATATLIDPAAEVQRILSRYKPHGLIGIPKAHLLRLKVPALRGLKACVSTGFTPLFHTRLQSLKGESIPVGSDSAPALLTFTSGTTGRPKAIARSHDFLLNQHRVLHGHMPFQSGDVDLPTLPVFLLHSLASGATCVIADADLKNVGEVEPGPVVNQMVEHGVTSTSGSPAFFRQLADHLIKTQKTLPALKHIYTGGARVPATLVDDLATVLPTTRLHVVYGSTEAEPIAVLDARANRESLVANAHLGALVGTPVSAVQIRIEAIEDSSRFGEIWVSGSHVNPGYVDNPEAEAAHKVHENGTVWHRTGDVGHLDEHGQLWLVGRVGESVGDLWPLAIEGAAEALPYVRKAGLVEVDGHPALAIELTDPPDNWQETIQNLAGATPYRVESSPFDTRHNAKVDRLKLSAMLSAMRSVN